MADNFLGEDFFKRLKDEFPSDEFFNRYINQQVAGGRIDLFKGMPEFHKFLQQSTCWRKFFEKINSQNFLEYMISIFGSSTIDNSGKMDPKAAKLVEYDPIIPKLHRIQRVPSRVFRDTRLRSFSRFIAGKFNSEEYYCEFRFAMAKPGYYFAPHTDNRNKWLAFVLFMDDFEGREGGLNILESKTLKKLCDNERYPKRDDLRIVKTFASKPNRFISFLNCNNSYHETVPWVADRTRRFVYGAISKKNCESMWDSNIFTLCDAMPKGYKKSGDPLPQTQIDEGILIE